MNSSIRYSDFPPVTNIRTAHTQTMVAQVKVTVAPAQLHHRRMTFQAMVCQCAGRIDADACGLPSGTASPDVHLLHNIRLNTLLLANQSRLPDAEFANNYFAPVRLPGSTYS